MVVSHRSVLRTATASAHQELEDAVGPLQSRTDYVRYLRGLHAFRAPLETWLNNLPLPAWFGSWRCTPLSPALLYDLRDLETQPLTLREHVPLVNVHGMLGTLYVLEGSSLGARVVIKRAAGLGFTKDYGARHLAQQIAASSNWHSFIEILEQHAGLDLQAAIHAANAAFTAGRMSFLRAENGY